MQVGVGMWVFSWKMLGMQVGVQLVLGEWTTIIGWTAVAVGVGVGLLARGRGWYMQETRRGKWGMGEHASRGRDVDVQLGNVRHASGNARHASKGVDNNKWVGDKKRK